MIIIVLLTYKIILDKDYVPSSHKSLVLTNKKTDKYKYKHKD